MLKKFALGVIERIKELNKVEESHQPKIPGEEKNNFPEIEQKTLKIILKNLDHSDSDVRDSAIQAVGEIYQQGHCTKISDV